MVSDGIVVIRKHQLFHDCLVPKLFVVWRLVARVGENLKCFILLIYVAASIDHQGTHLE